MVLFMPHNCNFVHLFFDLKDTLRIEITPELMLKSCTLIKPNLGCLDELFDIYNHFNVMWRIQFIVLLVFEVTGDLMDHSKRYVVVGFQTISARLKE